MKFSCWELAPFHGDSPQNTCTTGCTLDFFFFLGSVFFSSIKSLLYFFDLNCILHGSRLTFIDGSLTPNRNLFIFVQINV